LVQGAWGLVRSTHGGVLQKKYLLLKETKGKNRATTALARKLLDTMWVLATRRAMYLDYDPVSYQKKLKKYEVTIEGAA
jgi:hypothetical protein